MIRLWLLAVATVLLLCLTVPWWMAFSLLVPFGLLARAARDRGPRLYPKAMRDEIVAAQGVKCFYCGTETHDEHDCPQGGDCPDCRQIDHAKAWAAGGSTKVRNGRVSCMFCNGRKGAGTPAELRAKVYAEWRQTRRG